MVFRGNGKEFSGEIFCIVLRKSFAFFATEFLPTFSPIRLVPQHS